MDDSERHRHLIRTPYTVVKIDRDDDAILRNLFEFYLHDLAEWFGFDQLKNGQYTDSTDRYWSGDRDAYLLYSDDIPVGFGLVGPADPWIPGSTAREIEEFFVVRRHRGTGIASDLATYLWRRYPGPWLVRVFQPNLPALPFWRRTIAAFTGNAYDEAVRDRNGRPWSWFTFDSRGEDAKAG